ncbi:MAG: glycosyltransferase family 1 protein [Massilia sp.]
MKIAFDSQIFTMQKYGGISRYISSLAAELEGMDGVEGRIVAPFYINDYLRRLPKQIVSGQRVPKIPKMGLAVHISGRWLARRKIAQLAPDIVHETYYTRRAMAPRSARTVVTVYDMIHEIFPELYPARDKTAALKRAAVLRADHVICISENTRRDLLKFVPVAPEKVSVVYLGVDQLAAPGANAAPPPTSMALPYLLFVGGRGHYKNFNNVLRAYAASEWLKDNFRIVCVGGGKIEAGELDLMQELGIPVDRVEQVEANDNLLSLYYRNAGAFIYPSKYEGFGIPPLEAMSAQCAVLCSDASSIPEVVGDAGEYFDADNIDAIRAAIENVLRHKERRDQLIDKGNARCKEFSWARCASETLAIYRALT